MRNAPLKRKPSTLVRKGIKKKASKRPATKKKKRFNLWAEYGIERPAYVRYSGLGGVLWCVLSRYVRKSEFETYGGRCVDGCGRVVENWQDADCGHFRSARSLSTRFLRENLGLQTKYCNSPRGGNGNQYGFGKAIDQRYGPGTADRLTELSAHVSTPFKASWYDEQIRKYLELGITEQYRPDVPDT